VVIYEVLPNIGPQYRTQETKKYTLHFQIPAGVQFKRSRPSRVYLQQAVDGLEFGMTGPMFPVGGEQLSQIELGNASLKL
jgi:hypothetical protein